MTYFLNIYMYVDIFIRYYCNIRYVVLAFDEITKSQK